MAIHDDTWHFFKNLYALCRGISVVTVTMDTPLNHAVRQSRSASGWSAVLISLALCVTAPHWLRRVEVQLSTLPGHTVMVVISLVLCTLLAIPLTYGFVRLYTLIGHVMTLNVFKARGQRLRLLNFHTLLLSLSLPLAAGIVLYRVMPVLGMVWVGVVTVYLVVLVNHGYNLIFHRRGFGGLLLWMGGTLLTWFVLGIGLMALLVTVGVVGLFAVAVMRVGGHHP